MDFVACKVAIAPKIYTFLGQSGKLDYKRRRIWGCLMSSDPNPKVCDATDDAQGTKAGNKKHYPLPLRGLNIK